MSGESLTPKKTDRAHLISTIQKIYRYTITYLKKLEKYNNYLSYMDDRNSMSKTDPDATFVSKADYAIIADLHKIIPALNKELKKSKMA